VAFDKRQDHANGALTVRPSTNSNVIRSSAIDTAFTRGSMLIAMLMPCLYYLDQIGANLITDGCEFARGKTVIGAQFDGLQPEFANQVLSLDMHMQGLVAVEAVEEESVWTRDT
jgi:hypothetical protein